MDKAKYIGIRLIKAIREITASEEYLELYSNKKQISCNELVAALEYTIDEVKNALPIRLD